MLKRLIIVILIVVTIVFAPYYLAKLLSIEKTHDIWELWLAGAVVILGAVISIAIICVILYEIKNYIVNG